MATISRSNELAEKIRQRIQEEGLADGELFMTAEQLMAEYEVSRTVAREAISRLQAVGILEGRKRKGLVVRRTDPVDLLRRSLPALISSTEDWSELFQLRYALEVGAIELAVRCASDEQIEELGRVAEEIEAALRSRAGKEREIELDIEFHTLLLKMTGSRMILAMQQVLVEYFRVAPHLELTDADSQRIVWEHRELYQALRDRDVERARSMIRVQFRTLLEPTFPPADKNPSEPAS